MLNNVNAVILIMWSAMWLFTGIYLVLWFQWMRRNTSLFGTRKNKDYFKWYSFDKKLPTNSPTEQADILFGNPEWETFFRGIYTHVPTWSMRERLLEYKQDKDKFYEWGHDMPTHWCYLPGNPK